MAPNNELLVNQAIVKTSAAPPPPAETPKPADPAPAPGPVQGLINVKSNCGPSGASQDVTQYSGPNGGIDWLNCGLNDGGWNPPYIRVEDVITMDLGEAIKDPNSAFKACSEYIPIFQKYAGEFGVPAIMVASFAMQESGCNPHTVGGAGEQGLMQLTWDKCGQAPGGNCQDVDYNIRTGTKYFSDTLNANGGDLLKTIAGYNGWSIKMTFDQATAAGWGPCCRCQNNLDYLHQFLNGWCQNINAYSHNPPLGKYFNLNKCGPPGGPN
ncbi:lysozyme-like protein [Gloeophyllum trabeum ATCC 11539]|uniref:Lysozyme-like protein n=1 Tax=Gloeophyllum trabeum (strain ATCC 11539 / FP-39264 / Madison 617) TaxID=670483 RepID=S7QBP8_GLOTA|nr:lysozyme-like protein [Gloeophyllum trabeum ATCC 11539]EPQ57386.1 lysozyme-like protein [Gloeophyllum trabeum ATCC 11539]